MDKTIRILIVLLIILSPAALSAEDSFDLTNLGNSIIPYVQLDIMCSIDSYLSADENSEMRKYSANLDVYYKDLLYNRYSQDPWAVATVNLLTGGMGSLMNGNVLTGSILQAGFVGSYTFMVLGLVQQDPDIKNMNFLIAEIGAVAFGLAGLIIPFIEVSCHNDALKESLNL
ncbi:MAG: hypothetical protein JEZ04_03410 [Spirochaetales bacterium]|nr:hypothetical protein [Spirochaetales bacterium]